MSVVIHNLGLPRIGQGRELKFVLEKYWKGAIPWEEVQTTAREVKEANWEAQKSTGQDYLTLGDFSYYDHVLDTGFLLGHVPQRFQSLLEDANPQEAYFAAARGLSLMEKTSSQDRGISSQQIPPQALTKWFDTNYHYLVPELEEGTSFGFDPQGTSRRAAQTIAEQVRQARAYGLPLKFKVLGPLSYLYLSQDKRPYRKVEAKSTGFPDPRLDYLPELLGAYQDLFAFLRAQGIAVFQVDEPVLVLDSLGEDWLGAFEQAYGVIGPLYPIILTTYFGDLGENLRPFLGAPVRGFHLDLEAHRARLEEILEPLGEEQVLSLGVVPGRNVWAADLEELQQMLSPLAAALGERLWLAPGSDLLHLPWSIAEEDPPQELKGRLAFAYERLQELKTLQALLQGSKELSAEERQAYAQRREGIQQLRQARQARVEALGSGENFHRLPAAQRQTLQQSRLGLPDYPTTTIGSFPQTGTIRKLRKLYRQGVLTERNYRLNIQQIIRENIAIQEDIGLDVLVHGEPERSDMVSFFADALEGYWQPRAGWVQSYGSRCVRPPVIHGLIQRRKDLGKGWTVFAQSLTDKPVKGMLTGPVTLYKWAFPPQGERPQDVVNDLALALREEVLALEAEGIGIVQIDEPAYREVLPLKESQWAEALSWASRAFRLSHHGVKPETQIHTHMCYSDFLSIFEGIEAMDADVISIETSRGQQRLLQGLEEEGYSKGLGPGVYDIHSPLIPQQEEMVRLLRSVREKIPPQRLWVNPDCGLKTRKWEEVVPSLKAMVRAAQELRQG
jgi:5-methyltetrahydropteroyltriglutamate--homocysteine methyltransferase